MQARLFILLMATIVFTSEYSYAETYRRILQFEPININPAMLDDVNSVQIMAQIGEGLVRYDKNTLVPALAEKWEISQDLTTYKFYLRKGAKFSNGRQITADDVIFNLESVISAGQSSMHDISVIKGVKDFIKKQSSTVSGLRKISPTILEISLEKPFSPFLDILSAPNYVILPRESIEKLRNVPLSAVDSSGPYKIEQVDISKSIWLGKNPYYYNAAKIYFDKILYEIVLEEDKAKEGLISGKYDDVWPWEFSDLPHSVLARTKKVPSFIAKSVYLLFNLERGVTKNINVRRFIYSNLDIDIYLKLKGLPAHYKAYGIIPRGMLGYRDKPRSPINAVSVKQLEEAGCLIEKPCEITFPFTYLRNFEAAKAMVKSLEKYSPWIHVNLISISMEKWYEYIKNRNFNLMIIPVIPNYRDTYAIVKDLLTDEFSPPGLERKEIINLVEKALMINDKAERAKVYAKVDDILFEQMAVIPLYHGDEPFRTVNRDIEGYFVPLLGDSYLKIMDLRKVGLNKD